MVTQTAILATILLYSYPAIRHGREPACSIFQAIVVNHQGLIV
jgi:hypothetical protein